jgi:hypothetical protein
VRQRYLRPAVDIPHVFLYRNAVDFRKQSNSLAAIVELELGHNPLDGGLYANNPKKTWDKVLSDFSESSENVENIDSLISNGILYDLWVA